MASASSSIAGAAPALAFDGDAATVWRSDPRPDAEQHFDVDFGFAREFGGLVAALARRPVRVALRRPVLATTARGGRTVRRVDGAHGGTDAIALPEAEARYLRLALARKCRRAATRSPSSR